MENGAVRDAPDLTASLRGYFPNGRQSRIPTAGDDGLNARKQACAARYIRVSTDDQRYSLEQQSAVIDRFASESGIAVVRTYVDQGRSGVTVNRRTGLQGLLAEVLSGSAPFATIFVTDVSRWGRFQDPDEAAHYEFLCREAGVQVVYCAEPFADDSVGSVIKQLKRVMAGEYSRELSVKVRAGRRAKAARGRALGGRPIYGFRRQIVNADGSAGPVLEDGERKSRADQEVRYVWGPVDERAVIRRVFHLYVEDARGQTCIARALNHAGIPWRDGSQWTTCRVQRLLKSELVVGFQAYEKSVVDLGSSEAVRDRSRWRYVRVLDPIVDVDLFVAAQERAAALSRGQTKTDTELLRELRALLSRERPTLQAPTTYRSRFGSVTAAYSRVGFHYSGYRRGLNGEGAPLDREQTIAALRNLQGRHGRISLTLIRAAPELPCPSRIRTMFGSLPDAYTAAGVPWGRNPQVRAPATSDAGATETS